MVQAGTVEAPKRRPAPAVASFVRRRLIIADALGLALAFLAAELLFGGTVPADRLSLTQEYLLFVATLPGWVAVAKLYGLYDHDEERTDHSTIDDVVGVFHLVDRRRLARLRRRLARRRRATPSMTSSSTLLGARDRARHRRARDRARHVPAQRAYVQQNTIIVGAGDVGQLVARKLLSHPEYGINVVGFVDDAAARAPRGRPRRTWRCSAHRPSCRSSSSVLDVERVVVAFSSDAATSETLD